MCDVLVILPHHNDHPLGIACDSRLVVRNVHANSLASRVMKPGDRIQAANGRLVTSLDELSAVINENSACVIVFHLVRKCTNSDTNCTRSDAVRMKVGLTWIRDGPRLGVAIKQVGINSSLNFYFQVDASIIVSRITTDSLASHVLKLDDVIVGVDGHAVANRDTTKATIVELLAVRGYVTLTIERRQAIPRSLRECNATMSMSTASADGDADNTRKSSLKSILKKRTPSSPNIHKSSLPASRPMTFVDGLRLLTTSTPSVTAMKKHVQISQKHEEILIACDDSSQSLVDDGQNYMLITIDRSVK